MPADHLVEEVWDGRAPTTAAKTLQKYVSELRKALADPNVLRTEGAGYLLDVQAEQVDGRRFEALVREGDWSGALALWRGDVLAGVADCAFVAQERRRLEELRLTALEGRLEVDVARGRHAAAVAELADLVDHHPLREHPWALLMLALYRSGRQTEALRAYERHRRHLAEEVGVAPSPELRRLEAAILRHDPELDGPTSTSVPARGAGTPGNLPAFLTSFIGRRAERDDVVDALARHRLVTLTGPGGVGKTRLAVEAMGRVAGEYDGGIWLVDLARIASGELVPRAVTQILGVEEQAGEETSETLATALAHRPALLLLLDNCEHVAVECARLVDGLLRAVPHLSVLATSRHPLGIYGECVRSVAPMSDADAVRLFTERARLVRAAFDPDEDDTVAAVSDVCARLDRVPLAIELAAVHVRALEPAEIAERLDDRFRLLASPNDPRSRALGDTIRWSYDLLAGATQAVFDRLGVFVGSLTLEAAEAVCSTAEVPARDVLHHVSALVDHSLLVRADAPPAVARYRLLETIRMFALDRLVESGRLDAARRRHAEFFRALAERGAPQLYGPGEAVWSSRLRAEEPNLRAAIAWASVADPTLAVELVIALRLYWDVHWLERDALAHLVPLLDRADVELAPPLRGRALAAAAEFGANPGEARQARARAQEAVDLLTASGDERGLVLALRALGLALTNEGALDHAERVVLDALATAHRLGDRIEVGLALNGLGFVADRRSDHAVARRIHTEELAVWRHVGSRRGEATVLRRLAVAARHMGDVDEAEELCRRALMVWQGLDDQAAIAHVRTTLADIARQRGDDDAADALYHQALDGLRAIGDRRCIASTAKNLGVIRAHRGDHDAAAGLFVDGLLLRQELGDDAGLAECLEGLADLATVHGDHSTAVSLLAAAQRRRTTSGVLAPPLEQAAADALLASARSAVDPATYEQAWDRGQSFDGDELLVAARAVGC